MLEKRFEAFPGKSLPNDKGVFVGPRPAFLQVEGDAGLKAHLTFESFVVLAAEDRTHDMARLLPPNTVSEINQVKGLELNDVALCDFFSSIPADDQKLWKSLFAPQHLKTNLADIVQQLPQVEYQTESPLRSHYSQHQPTHFHRE